MAVPRGGMDCQLLVWAMPLAALLVAPSPAVAACNQTAPNEYTCLDGEWSLAGGILGVCCIVVSVAIYVRLHARRWTNLCCQVNYDDREASTLRELPVRTTSRLDDLVDPEVHDYRKITDTEIYLSTFDDLELHWISLLVWLKWRSAFDVLRALGEVLLVLKLIDVYGITEWTGLTGLALDWTLVMVPFFMLDLWTVHVLRQHDQYPLYFGEHQLIRAYALMGGFPFGTMYKILICVKYDGGVAVPDWLFWMPVLASVSVGLIYLLYCAFWKVRLTAVIDDDDDNFDDQGASAQSERKLSELNDRIRALEMPCGVLLMLVLGYVAFTFVGFVRVAWPAASGRSMNRDDHDYDNEGWRLSPDGNWAEASVCWFILAGGLVVLAWADWFVTLLPAEVYVADPFESVRKITSVITMTGTVVFLVMLCYHIDHEWSGVGATPFRWHLLVPLMASEGLNLLALAGIMLWAMWVCPDVVRNRHEMTRGVKDEYAMEATEGGGARFYPTGHNEQQPNNSFRGSGRQQSSGPHAQGPFPHPQGPLPPPPPMDPHSHPFYRKPSVIDVRMASQHPQLVDRADSSPVMDGFGTNVRPQLKLANISSDVASVARHVAPSSGQRQQSSFMSKLPSARQHSYFDAEGQGQGNELGRLHSQQMSLMSQRSGYSLGSGRPMPPAVVEEEGRRISQLREEQIHQQVMQDRHQSGNSQYRNSDYRTLQEFQHPNKSGDNMEYMRGGPQHGWAPQMQPPMPQQRQQQMSPYQSRGQDGAITTFNPLFQQQSAPQHVPANQGPAFSGQGVNGQQEQRQRVSQQSVRRPPQWGNNVDFEPPPPDYD